jgi:hypothetical protein
MRWPTRFAATPGMSPISRRMRTDSCSRSRAFIRPAGGMLRDAQVPKRVGHCQLVTDLGSDLTGPFKNGNRGVVVAADNLVETTDPEQ